MLPTPNCCPPPHARSRLQLSTFTVNYMGHPFNNSISENRIMYNVLKWMAVFLVVVLFDVIPGRCAWVACAAGAWRACHPAPGLASALPCPGPSL